jgi:hypothetical protein
MKTYRMWHKDEDGDRSPLLRADSSALRLSGYFLFVSYFPHVIAGPTMDLRSSHWISCSTWATVIYLNFPPCIGRAGMAQLTTSHL